MRRGEIYNCQLPNINGSGYCSVTQGYRPVVVVSSLTGIVNSDIVMVCPLTTKIKNFNVNVNISWSKDTRPSQVLCNQIMTLPKDMLRDCIGMLTDEEMMDVTSTMCAALGIVENTRIEIQKSVAALNQAKADREEVERLIPNAKQLITELQQLVNRINSNKVKITKKGRVKRTNSDLEEFCKEWVDPNNDRKEVIESFGFNSYAAAWGAYQRYMKKHGGSK